MFENPWKPVALVLLLLLALVCGYDYLVTRSSARAVLQYLNEPIGEQAVPRAEVLRQLLNERVRQHPAPVAPNEKP
jgi:hypothetical protein